jgi:GDPmannose 4,6-dehydratase
MTEKRALITGVTGQDGAYLAELLLGKGYEVHGVKRRSSSFNTGRIDHLYQGETRMSRPCDVPALRRHDGCDQPDPADAVHPAGRDLQSRRAEPCQVSFETPEYTANADAHGHAAAAGGDPHPRADQGQDAVLPGLDLGALRQGAGSAAERDDAVLSALPYAVAKLYAYWITVNYREAYGIHASNGILFNHESPLRGETFVTRKITRAGGGNQARAAGRLYLGNLDAKRDWGHARDYVEGMWRCCNRKPDDFVLAPAKTTVRAFVERPSRSRHHHRVAGRGR